MSDVQNLVEALDELTTEQLEQLNYLLTALRRNTPTNNLSAAQQQHRQRYLKKAVARLRSGLTTAELDNLISELTQPD